MAQLAWSFSLLRITPEPLDTSFVFEDMAAFTAYLASPMAYTGQIVAVKNGTNEPDVFLIYEDRTYGGFGGGGGGAGAQGPQGPQGSEGSAGIQGPQGPEGIGVQGPQGFQGSQGPIGAAVVIRGTAANHGAIIALPGPHTLGDLWIALSNGHGWVWNGTSFDDVGQIQGPAGVQGPQGFQGAQGAAGSQGVQGSQGSAGVQGSPGAQGSQGPQGIGTQGPQGSAGSQGAQGPIGSGVQGAVGPQGSQGTVGPQGSQGPVGSGVQGSQGAQGAQGSQGAVGSQGGQGPPGITTIGGDLAGTPANAVVWALRGHQIADVVPAFRQFLMWDGNRWTPADLPVAPPAGAITWDGSATNWDGGTVTWS